MKQGNQVQTSEKKPEEEHYADTMEMEKKRQKASDFNEDRGLLVNAFSEGLNRNRGVFAGTAIFLTDREGNGDENAF